MAFTSDVKVEIFPERLLTPTGPVSELVHQVALRMKEVARDLIGIRRYSGHHPNDGTHLRDRGQVIRGSGASWIVAFVKTNSKGDNIALIHHDGSTGHPIGEEGKALFRNGPGVVDRHGNTRFFRRRVVDHPGTTGNPYLINAATQVGLTPSGGLKRGTAPATPIFRTKGFV